MAYRYSLSPRVTLGRELRCAVGKRGGASSAPAPGRKRESY